MTNMTWEKSEQAAQKKLVGSRSERWKFLVGGVIMLVAIVYLVISSTTNSAQYFISIDELVNDSSYVGKTVRVTGAVIGDTILYDEENLIIDFTVANIESDTKDLALTLYQAVNNPEATRMSVHVENQVMPDLLQHEAQAILTGVLGEDGVFYATELLLKCPSRYGESVPDQVGSEA